MRKVGALAAATGLTIRRLHHYEEIGLLVAARTESGHRVYGDEDVERLYRIGLLRRLGLPLGDIAKALDDPAWDMHAAMTRHLHDVDRRIEDLSRLRTNLAHLLARPHTEGLI